MSAHGMVSGFEDAASAIAMSGLAGARNRQLQQAQAVPSYAAEADRAAMIAHGWQARALAAEARAVQAEAAAAIDNGWQARALAAEARAAEAEAVAMELLDDAEDDRVLIAQLQATIDRMQRKLASR